MSRPKQQEIQTLAASAQRCLERREYGIAIDVGGQLIALGAPTGFEVLARAHEGMGDRAAAIAHLEHGVDAFPTISPLWHALAVLLSEEGRYEAALAAIRSAWKCMGADCCALAVEKAAVLRKMGRASDALALLERCEKEISPELAPRLVAEAVESLIALGNPAAAVDFAMQAAVRLGDRGAERGALMVEVGLALLSASGDVDGARAALTAALEEGGSSGRGLLLMRRLDGKPLEAAREYRVRVEGAASFPLNDGRPARFSRELLVVAPDPSAAQSWALRLEPEAARPTLKIEPKPTERPVAPGTVEGVYWCSGPAFHPA